ncbi:MAG: hypothetical protein KKI08_06565, partial [Armatimonadetes bacterium]|nr:hypothetical protein [Armatimonadota bacterium]
VDAETLEWEQFINAWWHSHGQAAVETAQLFGLATDEDLLSDVLGPGNDRSQRSLLGRALSRMDGRCFTIASGPERGVTLTVPGTDGRKNTKVYQLKPLGECLQ